MWLTYMVWDGVDTIPELWTMMSKFRVGGRDCIEEFMEGMEERSHVTWWRFLLPVWFVIFEMIDIDFEVFLLKQYTEALGWFVESVCRRW